MEMGRKQYQGRVSLAVTLWGSLHVPQNDTEKAPCCMRWLLAADLKCGFGIRDLDWKSMR
jgi:hypothetical protein